MENSEKKQNKNYKIKYKILLLIISLLFCCLAIEIIIRIKEKPPEIDKTIGVKWNTKGENLFHIKSQNPSRAYELRPNTSIYVKAFKQTFTTNSAGFRDREFTQKKGKGIYRIVAIGDSVTFGWRQAIDKTYPKVLEKLFIKNKKKVEVLNMGVGGYNTLQEVEVVKDKALLYSPDLIIVGYVLNDNNIGKDNGLWQHFSKTPSAAYDYFSYKISRIWRKYGKSVAEEGFEKLAQIAKKQNIPILIVIFPILDKNPNNFYAHHQQHKNTAKLAMQKGFGVIDLYKVYDEEGLEKLKEGNDIIHPNDRGHQIAAEIIFKYLQKNIMK